MTPAKTPRAPLGRDLMIILRGLWGMLLQLAKSVGRRPPRPGSTP